MQLIGLVCTMVCCIACTCRCTAWCTCDLLVGKLHGKSSNGFFRHLCKDVITGSGSGYGKYCRFFEYVAIDIVFEGASKKVKKIFQVSVTERKY